MALPPLLPLVPALLAGLVGLLGASPALAAAGPSASPAWVPPVRPVEVARAFDPPATAYGAGHRGADLRAPVGTVVVAAGAGRVSHAGRLAGRGTVTVTHAGALRTTYEPVSAWVAVGDRVTAGEALGQLEAPAADSHLGRARCACLHWGLLRGTGSDEAYLDPMRLLRRDPAVLLPLSSVDRSARWGAADRLAAPGRLTLPSARAVAGAASRPRDDRSGSAPERAGRAEGTRLAVRAGLAVGGSGALVAGVLLLAGRRPRLAALPDRRPDPDPGPLPQAPALAVPAPGATPAGGDAQRAAPTGAEPVDLAAERLRRRAG